MWWATTPAKRIPDGPPIELQPGEYQKVLLDKAPYLNEGEVSRWEWWFRAPNGTLGRAGKAHTIKENKNGTITVSPSLWFKPGQHDEWHGFFFEDTWEDFNKTSSNVTSSRVHTGTVVGFLKRNPDKTSEWYSSDSPRWRERWSPVPRQHLDVPLQHKDTHTQATD